MEKIGHIGTEWCMYVSLNGVCHHYTHSQRSCRGGILDSPCLSIRPSVCASLVQHKAITLNTADLLSTEPIGKKHWYLNQDTNIFYQENAFKNTVCQMAAIFFCWPQDVYWVMDVTISSHLQYCACMVGRQRWKACHFTIMAALLVVVYV